MKFPNLLLFIGFLFFISLSHADNSLVKTYPKSANSKTFYKKTIIQLQQNEVVDTISNKKFETAKTYQNKGQYDLAKATLYKILSDKDNDISHLTKAEVYYQLGLLENKTKGGATLNLLEKSLYFNSKANDLKQKSKIVLALSHYYKRTKNYDLAYSLLEEHYQLKNHLQEIENAKSEYLAYKKIKNSELANEAQQREKEEKAKTNSEKYTQLISILAIALISILSLLSLSLYKNNIIRNHNNIVLKEKNHELLIAKNKAEKASKARAEFLSTVSHELRTPLNAINGITHLLLEEKPKKSQIGYLESLKFSGNYLTTFINEILEINRIESNKMEIEHISFNLKELMTNIKSSLKEMAYANHNQFELHIDENIPDNLIGDPTKLAQIVMNLINNALKFTQNGLVHVAVNLNSIDEEKHRALLYFEIVDTGIGIPADKLQTVFESFSQGSVEVNRKYGGTGLGLTIVKKLVEILGGKIKLKSEVGKGSTFSFHLNFDICQEQVIKLANDQPYEDSVLAHKKILLIEDNKINQMITKKMLENKKMECMIIDNGEDAIEAMKNNTYDLILMDVHLPGINGTSATEEIRKFNTTTPIIALTAISLSENRESLLAFGMDDVVTKPFIPEVFYTTIAKHLSKD